MKVLKINLESLTSQHISQVPVSFYLFQVELVFLEFLRFVQRIGKALEKNYKISKDSLFVKFIYWQNYESTQDKFGIPHITTYISGTSLFLSFSS